MNKFIEKNITKSRSQTNWVEESLNHIQYIFAE